jgi:hypothetical protein
VTKGGIKYVPKDVLDELNRIKVNLKFDSDSEAFREMVENCRIGREIKFTMSFNKRKK